VPDYTAEALAHGLELRGDDLTFFFERAEVHPLRYNDDLGEWVSSSRLTFGEKHYLLVERRARTQVEQFLSKEGADGKVDPGVTLSLPDGWFLFRDVRLDTRPVSSPPPALADHIGTAGGLRLRLVGGLGVTRLQRTYLTGGAPRLALPADASDNSFELVTDGYDPIPRTTVSGEFALNAFNLGPGTYEVRHARGSLGFDLIEGIAMEPSADVGSIRLGSTTGQSAAGLRVEGVSPAKPATVAVRGTELAMIIGASSGEHAAVKVPLWLMSIAGPLSWKNVDVWTDFAPAWHLSYQPTARRYVATPLRPNRPRPGGAGTRWAQLIEAADLAADQPEGTAELWEEYVAAAKENNYGRR
jgi:hypothetical protein